HAGVVMTTVATERRDYPGLDSLRGLAAISVLATHTSFWTGQYTHGLWGAATERLNIGVSIFFVLSGFLLGRPFIAAMAARTRAPGARRYFWHRALRIIPVFLLATVIAILALPENQGVSVATWVGNLTLTQLYITGLLPAGLSHMWSLTTEVAFYLVLPLLMTVFARTACRRRWNPWGMLFGVALMVTLNVAWLGWMTGIHVGAHQWLPGFAAWFGVGIALAIVTVDMSARGTTWPRLTALAHQPGLCWSMAAGLFAISTTPVAGPVLLVIPSPAAAITRTLLFAAIGGLVVLPSVLGPSRGTRYSDALAWAPLRHVGHISYSFFCLHLLVVHGVARVLDIPLFTQRGWELFSVSLVVSLIAAEITYRLVERPTMKLKNRWIGASKAKANVPAMAASTHH
ncbi:MAG: acyltransferase, partial [Aeromicrobium sp.]